MRTNPLTRPDHLAPTTPSVAPGVTAPEDAVAARTAGNRQLAVVVAMS